MRKDLASKDQLPGPSSVDSKVLRYHCRCGATFEVHADRGGKCESCERIVNRQILEMNLSVTIPVSVEPSGKCLDATTDFDLSDRTTGEEVETLPQGTRLGHFEVIEPLGAGGMGQVYRAFDRSLQRYVALKVLRSLKSKSAGNSTDSEFDNLIQEAVAQARVPHLNIVPIYYIGRQDGAPFLAMELVAGKTLLEKMAEGPIPFAEIAGCAWQVTDALRFSHELDLIHGDLKPSNILVLPSGLAKLSDFGMARSASEKHEGPVGGTPNYLAPELLEGGKPSVCSDIYSLGVTFYEMTFGARPIQLSGRTPKEWAESHRNQSVQFPKPWPESFPEFWQTILRRMLAANPQNRYQNYAELQKDLYRILPSTNRPARWLPRIIAATIDYTLILIVTLVAIGGGWFLLGLLGGYLNIADSSFIKLINNDAPWYADAGLMLADLLVYSGSLLPWFGHLMATATWRHSLGRELMQVQVVNRFGLPPGFRMFFLRELVRTVPLGLVPVVWIFIRGFEQVETALFLFGCSVLFTFINTVLLVLTPSGRALHDRWLKTRTVLESSK